MDVGRDPNVPRARSSVHAAPAETIHQTVTPRRLHHRAQFAPRVSRMRPVLTLLGAFGGAAACVGGAAVGYGTMLGATPRPCPHCDDDADVRRGGGGGGRRAGGRKTSSSSSSSSAASPGGGGGEAARGVRRARGRVRREARVARAPDRDQSDAMVDDAAGQGRGARPRPSIRFSSRVAHLSASLTPHSSLLRRAHQVLEVAAGTGRNFAYYPAGTKLTATDCSEPMVDVCRAKGEASRGPTRRRRRALREAGRQGRRRRADEVQDRIVRHRRRHVWAVQLRRPGRDAARDGEGCVKAAV